MSKTLLLLAVFITLATPAVAQNTSSYTVDNFDFNAVRIEIPVVAQPKPVKLGRKSTSQNIKYTPPEGSLVHLTSWSANPSLGGFTTGNEDVDKFIVESGRRNSVDPLLLYSIMHQESTFKARALSPKGARGLMQLMPPTAARFGVTNIWDPRQNIEGGARYSK